MGMDAGEISGRVWDTDISVRTAPRADAPAPERAIQEQVFRDRVDENGVTITAEQQAQAAIDALPPSDTDFAIMPNPNGSGVVVRELEQDMTPDTAYHGRLIRNNDFEAVSVTFRDRSGNMSQVTQRNQTIRPDGAGPVRERTELTDIGHGRRGLGHILDGEQGGTLGSQAADGSRTENWRIVSE